MNKLFSANLLERENPLIIQAPYVKITSKIAV